MALGNITKFFREPILQFAVLGAGLFTLHYVLTPKTLPETDTAKRISVTRDNVLDFLQNKKSALNAKTAQSLLNEMTDKERSDLIYDYIHEEALYREAKTRGLHKYDNVIRRRLVKKMELISSGAADAVNVKPNQVAEFFAANQQKYQIAPTITFTHIFFDAKRNGSDHAQREAQQKLHELNTRAVPFFESTKHGDQFHYHQNYVERTKNHIARHFGPQTTNKLFAMEPDKNKWQGPFQSKFGWHVVLVTAKTRAHIPPLNELRNRVRRDLQRKIIVDKQTAAAAKIIKNYDLEIAPNLRENKKTKTAVVD